MFHVKHIKKIFKTTIYIIYCGSFLQFSPIGFVSRETTQHNFTSLGS